MNTVSTDKRFAHAVFFGERAERLYGKNADGKVVGVFSHALYAAFDGEILSFYAAEYGEIPFGVALTDVLAFLRAADAEEGAEIAFAPGAVRIGAQILPLAVTAPPTRIQTAYARPTVARLLYAEDYIAAHGATRGIPELFAANRGGAADSAARLIAAFRSGNAAAASSAAVRLLGLGRGLTPSGDDYLCGFFATLLAARRSSFPVPPLLDRVVAAVLGAAATRTSPISAAYLVAALTEAYCTVYAAATAAVLGCGEIKPFADIALRMGASSGTDTLCGALAAARLLIADDPAEQ